MSSFKAKLERIAENLEIRNLRIQNAALALATARMEANALKRRREAHSRELEREQRKTAQWVDALQKLEALNAKLDAIIAKTPKE